MAKVKLDGYECILCENVFVVFKGEKTECPECDGPTDFIDQVVVVVTTVDAKLIHLWRKEL